MFSCHVESVGVAANGLAFPEARKSKYLVVASVDVERCTFVVNSRVHPFIGECPELSICQGGLDVARHEFLRRESWIDCHQVLRLRTEAVVSELVADMGRLKGHVHQDVLNEIIAAVKCAPTLSIAEQTFLVKALERVAS